MGMFDYVQYEAPCTSCGETISEWQTKHRDAPSLARVTPAEIVGGTFYERCPSCNAWNEYVVHGIGYVVEPVRTPQN